MKLFNCEHCGALLFFENRTCETCQAPLGYLPDQATLSALKPVAASVPDPAKPDTAEPDTGEPDTGEPATEVPAAEIFTASAAGDRRVKLCANAADDVCNWLLDADSKQDYCAACRHNRTIPDVTTPEKMVLWRKLEFAKHRLFYSLIRLGMPLPNRADDPEEGLVFDFLDDLPGGPKVLTGHDNGIITIAAKEADDAHREEMRAAMHESYRTLLGHFRHEVGHWIWDRLVRDGNRLEEYRTIFGDDREDYEEALKRHYADGPAPDWQESFISAYATSHSWEDFAETWAHYLHIMDTLETANAFGMGVKPKVKGAEELTVKVAIDPYTTRKMQKVIDQWLPLTFAMNNLNRSMGLSDLYPFVITQPVREKLAFIHRLLHDQSEAAEKDG